MIHVQDCEFNETFWPHDLELHTFGWPKCSRLSIPHCKVKGVYIGMQTVCKVMLLTSVDFRESGISMRNN